MAWVKSEIISTFLIYFDTCMNTAILNARKISEDLHKKVKKLPQQKLQLRLWRILSDCDLTKPIR